MKEIVPKTKSRPGAENDVELSNLFKMIRLGSQEEVEEAVDKYLDYTSFPAKSLQQHHIDIMELMIALFRFSANHDIESEEFSGDIRNLYTSLLDLEPDALRRWLLDSSLDFREKLIHARNKSTKSFVSLEQISSR